MLTGLFDAAGDKSGYSMNKKKPEIFIFYLILVKF